MNGEVEKRWGRESMRGDTVMGVCHRPPSQLEGAKDAFLIPVTPEEKLGLGWSISATGHLFAYKADHLIHS